MKKIITFLIFLSLVFVLSACQTKPELIIADQDKTIVMNLGETKKINLEITDGFNATVESSNLDVVSIELTEPISKIVKLKLVELTITAEGEGEAVVKVMVENKNIFVEINVTVNDQSPESVNITGASMVVIGEELQLSGSVLPENANQQLTWTSSNVAIATVDNTGKVTGVAEGNVDITATSIESSVKKTVSIEVVLPNPTGITITGEGEVVVEQTAQYTAVIDPSLATQDVVWSVDDETIATIDQEGLLTAVSVGNVKVIATSTQDQTIKSDFDVTIVLPIPTAIEITGDDKIKVGETTSYTAVVTPQLSSQEIEWSVSDDTLATIDDLGVLTAIKDGVVKVIATSKVSTNVFEEFEVTILGKVEQIIVDAAYADLPSGQIVKADGIDYTIGLTAFADLNEVTGNLDDGVTIIVKAGEYSGSLTIDKDNVTIIGPNKDIDPNTQTRRNEAVITGTISIVSGVEDFEINGVMLTAGGRILGSENGGIDGVKFAYIYITATTVDPALGIIHLRSNSNDNINYNLEVKNSFFDTPNSDARMIRTSNLYNLTVTDSVFLGGFDIMRLMGTNETNSAGIGIAGSFIVDNNYFTGAKQFVMFGVRYDFSYFQLTNNVFENMAGQFYGGIIDARTFNNSVDSVHVVVKYNIFKDVFDWHLLRFTTADHTIDTYKVDVNYNAFITTPGAATYCYVRLNSSTSQLLANADYNFYTGTDFEPYIPTASNFVGVSSYDHQFDSYNDLLVAIEYDKLGETGADVLLVGSSDYEIDKPLYASIEDALVAANPGDTIYLLPGTYSENLTINKDNITITTFNGRTDPTIEDLQRLSEVFYTGKITINARTKGFEINGIYFTGNAQIVNQAGPAGTAANPAKNLEGFTFKNNIVETELTSGKGFIYFVESGSSYSHDIVFENNGFTTKEETDLESVIYIDNHVNLTLVGNIFVGIKNNAVYVNDVTKGLSGNTFVEGNNFIAVGGSAFWVNWLSPLPGTVGEIRIVNNYFDEIGERAIHLAKMNNTDNYSEISIQYNTFSNINIGVYLVRVHANANIKVNYNKFYDIANTYYIQNATDGTTSSPSKLDARNNLFMLQQDVITPDVDKFAGDIDFVTPYTEESQVPIYAGEGEVVVTSLQIVDIIDGIFTGDKYQLQLIYTPENATTLDVIWSSDNENLATVNDRGLLTAVSSGSVTITATSIRNPSVFTTIEINIQGDYENIELRFDGSGVIEVDEELEISTVLFGLTGNIEFTSLNSDIATVTPVGVVKGVSEGVVVIEAKLGNNISTVTLMVRNRAVEGDPIQFVIDAHLANVLARDVRTYGNTTKVERTFGAVSLLWFGGELDITERIMPMGNGRPGTKLNSIEFVVIHDTGNNNAGAGALMHANWLMGNPGVSWHYTVDSSSVYQHLPLDEVGYHAGDGLRAFGLNDTAVQATTDKPVITISNDGYYQFNGQKSIVEAPLVNGNIAKTSDITSSGLFTSIGDNGNYYINNTYYNTTYRVISNQGGGRNGIGIEKAISEGSDLYSTWQRTAKLTAQLLQEFDLGLDRITQHNNFSGKNCPQVLRTEKLFDLFVLMVDFELELMTMYQDYTFSFESNNPTIINNHGKVINQPRVTTEVSYTVTITNNSGYNQSITLYATIPGSKTL